MALSLWNYLFTRNIPGQNESNPLNVKAVPGLMTLVDVALYRANEGQLTATVCAGHALLCVCIQIKQQALEFQKTLENFEQSRFLESAESFALLCIQASSDAILKLSGDKLAQSASLAPQESSYGLVGVGSQGVANGVLESKSSAKTEQDWESLLLHCPDYVWADDALQACQRLMRTLAKHAFFFNLDISREGCDWEAKLLVDLIKIDLPMRMHQFKCAMEADSVVSKRLYLVKCEYRAPFRAFLESHLTLQKAPPIELVDEYLEKQKEPAMLKDARINANQRVQECLESPQLKEALGLEQGCEQMEVGLAQTLYPFTELARLLDSKRTRLKAVSGILQEDELPALQETLNKLKFLLCRKAGPETSTGIRPLLMDLQATHSWLGDCDSEKDGWSKRLDILLHHLDICGKLCKHWKEREIPSWVVKGCGEVDHEIFKAQHHDWYVMSERQALLGKEFRGLSDKLREAEIEMSIAVASHQALGVVRQRLELLDDDRSKRFTVLKEMLEDLCLREMNLHISLEKPDKDAVLELKSTSALGVFGNSLKLMGEECEML